jgi:hypothetical protein
MRKTHFFGIGLVLLGLVSWGIYKLYEPHRNVEGENAVATLSAINLYNEFQKNENSANKKWVGKVVEIRGTIYSVSEMENYVSINLRATADGGINCSLQKKDLSPGEKFNHGDIVTIKGKCTGFLMDVDLVDCVIKK